MKNKQGDKICCSCDRNYTEKPKPPTSKKDSPTKQSSLKEEKL